MSQIVSRALRVKPCENSLGCGLTGIHFKYQSELHYKYYLLSFKFLILACMYISLSDTAVIVDVAYNEPLLMNTLCRQTD